MCDNIFRKGSVGLFQKHIPSICGKIELIPMRITIHFLNSEMFKKIFFRALLCGYF